jgi:hypothetical protein
MPVSRRSREAAQVVPNTRAITQAVASVDALPALLGRGEFRDGAVPPGAGPLGVDLVRPAKGIALKAGPRELKASLEKAGCGYPGSTACPELRQFREIIRTLPQ